VDKLGLPITLESVEENLFDIAGVRVVCSFVDDITPATKSQHGFQHSHC
jgi:ppGpp synthetase/RelA/SpoT-type nucleotidyltranferase